MSHIRNTPYPAYRNTLEFPTRIYKHHVIRIGYFAWFMWLCVTVSIFVFNALYFFERASIVCDAPECTFAFALTPQIADNFIAYGMSPIVWATHILFLDALLVTTYIGVATIIYLRRPDDWLVMVTTGMLMGISINVALSNSTSPFANSLDWLPNLHTLIAIYLTFKFLAVFPDGRYVPKWTRYWVYVAMLWEVGRRIFAGALTTDTGIFRVDLFLSTFILASIGMVAQVIRYHRHSTPNQRQQAKWAILGGALCLLNVSLSAGLYFTVLPILEARGNALWLNIILRLLYYSGFFLLIMGLGFSVVRYRIWEADLAINRSVVYFFVSILLGLTFLGGLVISQRLLNIVLGQEMDILATIIATGLVVGLAPRIQKQVRSQIDKRVFGFRQDLIQLNKQQQQRLEIYAEGKAGALSGQVVGDGYVVGALIGKGGMGQVYHALHQASGKRYALKILADVLFHEEVARQRFEREAQLATRLAHPHIVPVTDAFSDDQHLYLIMPYIDGQDLWSIYKAQKQLPFATLLPILRQIADALDYLHQQGVVHRDIKPSNIMVSADQHAWLLDFGIAKWVHDSHILTHSGILGTLDYTAPEQLVSSRDVDHRADIYALGVMTYQLLAGGAPFVGNVGNLVFAHLNQPAPDIRAVVPSLPDAVALALMRCMAKDANDRYESAGAFVQALVDIP